MSVCLGEPVRRVLRRLTAKGGWQTAALGVLAVALLSAWAAPLAVAATPMVAAGDDHTVVLRSNGVLYACGANSYGQLGVGDTAWRTSFVRVDSASDWAFVACAGDASFADQAGRDALVLGPQQLVPARPRRPDRPRGPAAGRRRRRLGDGRAGLHLDAGPQARRHPVGMGTQRRGAARPGRHRRPPDSRSRRLELRLGVDRLRELRPGSQERRQSLGMGPELLRRRGRRRQAPAGHAGPHRQRRRLGPGGLRSGVVRSRAHRRHRLDLGHERQGATRSRRHRGAPRADAGERRLRMRRAADGCVPLLRAHGRRRRLGVGRQRDRAPRSRRHVSAPDARQAAVGRSVPAGGRATTRRSAPGRTRSSTAGASTPRGSWGSPVEARSRPRLPWASRST